MPDTRRIEVVEYLRGVACLAVAWFHLTNGYEFGAAAVSGSYGWLGVDVFFVISGFIVPYSLASARQHYSIHSILWFLARRVIRLEPPYLASVVLTLVLLQLSSAMPWFKGEEPHFDSLQIASHLFYFVPITGHRWLQPVYWTLGYEFIFYIVIGLSYWILSGIRSPIVWLLASAATIVGALSGYLPALSLLFVMGVALFRGFVGIENFLVSVAVTMCCGLAIAYSSGIESAVVGLATFAIISLGEHAELRNGLGKVLLFLGAISYSLYLTHVPIGGRIVNLGTRFVEGPAQEFFLSILALAISIAFAWIFYAIIERPAIELSRRLALRRYVFEPLAH